MAFVLFKTFKLKPNRNFSSCRDDANVLMFLFLFVLFVFGVEAA